MKTLKNVNMCLGCQMKIMKPNLLHDLLHGIDSTMCKKRKPRIMQKCQSKIASKPANGMQGYTMKKYKHLKSLKAVELRALVIYGIYRT